MLDGGWCQESRSRCQRRRTERKSFCEKVLMSSKIKNTTLVDHDIQHMITNVIIINPAMKPFLLFVALTLLFEIVSPLQRPFILLRGGGVKPFRFVSSALFASTTTTTNDNNDDEVKQQNDQSSLYKNKQVVVVGGGPVGLAAALTLSNAPHNYNVTVLEQSPEASAYDPTKAYLYLVNPRGQTWTQQFPRVQQLLAERGSLNRGMGNLILVPADPEVDVPELASRSTLAPPPKDPVDPSYWIPRHAMVKLLEQVVQEQQEEKTGGGGGGGSIQYLPHVKCSNLRALDNGQVEIQGEDVTSDENAKSTEMNFVADLVVAGDGANSAVRDHLNTAATTKQEGDWLSNHKKDFQIKVWNSAASLLRMKVLQFPPGFRIPPVTSPTQSEQTYAIRCKYTGPRNYVSLGLLPVKDPDAVRPTNVITRPDHDIWKITNGPEMKTWFQSAFPRFALSSDEGNAFEGMIDDVEWDRFANALGTTFPQCQYCPSLQVSSGKGTGVVLVGDACHAFPPDIGQGINAGLADVVALDRALQGKDLITGEASTTTKPNLEDALETYERIRVPEIKSLIRLARFGSPYQYRQPHYRDKIGRNLWMINVLVKTMLNKVSGGFIPGAAIIGAFDKKYTYRQLMRRSDASSVLLWTILAVACQRFVGTTGTIIGVGVATALWFVTYWFGK